MKLLATRTFNGVSLDCYQDETNKEDFWATREQIGMLLEYAYPNDAIRKIHERNAERLNQFSTSVNLTGVEGNRTVTREMTVYNFKGLLEICRFSNQPKANAVMDFLWEIADEIRRTGSYGLKPDAPELVSIAEMRIRAQSRANDIEAAKIIQRMIETPAYSLSEEDKRKLTRKIALTRLFRHIDTIPSAR